MTSCLYTKIWVYKFEIQDSNEPIPLESERLARLKILLESGTAQGNAAVVYQETNVKSESGEYPWKAEMMDLNKNAGHLKIFQPHLDLINASKNSEEELNVTKSSANGDFAKIDEVNSDEDSGHSSANSSGNEESKKTAAIAQVKRLYIPLPHLTVVLLGGSRKDWWVESFVVNDARKDLESVYAIYYEWKSRSETRSVWAIQSTV